MKSNAVTFLYKFSHRKWHHSERDSKLVGVSIHVPTRGTTESIELDVYFKAFQSTFPQGERRCAVEDCDRYVRGFNPRSRKGNDVKAMPSDQKIRVSIHVPARGTTTGRNPYIQGDNVSIHVPARGTTSEVL